MVKSLQPDLYADEYRLSGRIVRYRRCIYENAAGQRSTIAFNGPGISCNKPTKTWFWRTTGQPPVTSACGIVALSKMKDYFPKMSTHAVSPSANRVWWINRKIFPDALRQSMPWHRNRFSGFSNQAIPFIYIRFTAAFLKFVPALPHLPALLPSRLQTALQLLHFPALPRFHS